ncbi:serine/threonine-protein kinase Sgk2 [Elsinoe ampelina]|uniref:non-specific serine/threonine protein kinase n=1 Tax=Elsinoe ampelina TaxID=302913 RepID=A0A6A6FZ57_9PEZI|nr:serine/threonine-protein kinase Sgk2 [Elsinoe ampelina]
MEGFLALKSPLDVDDEKILDNVSNRIHDTDQRFDFLGSRLRHLAATFIQDRKLEPPRLSNTEAFTTWLEHFSKEHLEDTQHQWHISKTEGATLLLMKQRVKSLQSGDDETWQRVQIIGHVLCDGGIDYEKHLVRLCTSALRVFMAQPTRLYLIGFYLRGSRLEVVVLDRSGMYPAVSVDMANESRLLELVVSFRFMTDRDLGRSAVIQMDVHGSFIRLGDSEMLYLEGQTIAQSDELVGDGTTCYRGRSTGSNLWHHVVKFKWPLTSSRPENELLRLAAERGVEGLIKLRHYQAFDRTSTLRQGYHNGPYRRITWGSQPGSNSGVDDMTVPTDEPFEDRILTCVVTTPAGRPLRTFADPTELLIVFRDAVKAHRSLFQVGKILHRDISAQNIIIVDHSPWRGYLIDLDVAIDLSNGPTTTDNIAGTRPFMSIGILKKRKHTYRHDLESFLYVFLWVVICDGSSNPTKTSRLRRWFKGTWEESATMKMDDMREENFHIYLDEFPPRFTYFKQVAEAMRGILFPVHNGQLWTGTDGSLAVTNQVYDGIIAAFQRAIDEKVSSDTLG